MVVLLAARASRVENQDAIDMAIINMLADPREVLNLFARFKSAHIQNSSWQLICSLFSETRMLRVPCQARANITEVHFLPFNPVDKRTAITYIDSDHKWFRVSKGAPEQVLLLKFIVVSLNP